MMRGILAVAEKTGTGNRCVVCHGGNPDVGWSGDIDRQDPAFRAAADQAHSGTPAYFLDHEGPKRFYPDPGSPWINRETCGTCHAWEVDAQWKSLMMTEAGKIQGTAWGFGGLEGYQHTWANYDVANPDDADDVMGSEVFRKYLGDLASRESQAFPDKMVTLPPAPTASEIRDHPEKAAFTYLRGECQRCHLGVEGKQRHGDYRGMGCSACHMPYSNAGKYQGGDRSLDPNEPGHMLVHQIQSTADTTVSLGDITWSGIPVETCSTCHNRGARIGVSFQGLMETAYTSPWAPGGAPQQKLHGKHYTKLQADVHAQAGFLCQDCHTSLDVHSPNRLAGTIAAAVEIECTDCHGTPDRFPWELPIGYGDEYAESPAQGPDRGVADELNRYHRWGWAPPKGDGYLLSARGNPLGNVVRHGDEVWVYLASGELKVLEPLKLKAQKGTLSLEGRVAMKQVETHLERMECYACHATWAPQCYGCHVKVDYSAKEGHLDWVALGHQHGEDGVAGEKGGEQGRELPRNPGKIQETRSYLRWEDPALAVDGEGRIAPTVPGCQTTVTVIDGQGKPRVVNHIYQIPGVEGGGEAGQLAIDMAPIQPHTTQHEARACVSCHGSEKAAGYGIGGGRFYADPGKDHPVDLMTADGRTIPRDVEPQMAAIDGLTADWSRFVDENGQQLQTVGHHFTLSRPLNETERSLLDRQGVCLACHQEIPAESLAVGVLHHIADTAGLLPETDEKHSRLLHKTLLLAGWVQVGGPAGVFLVLTWVVFRFARRRRG